MNSSNSAPIWLGIDLGTQSVRALAVSARGETLGMGSHPLTSQRDGVRHEQDPLEWWSAVVASCRAALRGLPAESVEGAAVDATSGTILLMDAGGRPATPALMYDDTRAADEAKRVNVVGAAMWGKLGYHRMQAAWGLPKLLWLLREYARAAGPRARLAHQSDFINRRLVGEDVATDTSNALKTGCDLMADAWPGEIFDTLDIPPAILPPIVRSGAVLGVVCAAAATETGIPEGTPVIAGMTDGCAAQVGSGALDEGSWNSVLGTTLVLKGVTHELLRDPLGVVYSHRSPDGMWLPGGASSVGAGVIGKHFAARDLDTLGAQADERGPVDLVAYPLIARGERFPFNAPEAEGFMLGEPRDEIEHYAALLQGVAFIERLCFEYLAQLGAPVGGDLRVTGGGAKSRHWCQLRADVLGRPVTIPENAEAALGMAVLAASHGRRVADVAAEMVRVREVLEPRPDRTDRFKEPYERLVKELARRGWLRKED